MMLAQNDIKKTLGFSTIGQMGYMIMECGLGAFALAVFHLIAHGLFKATVFLNCGNVIHKARQEPHFPHADDQPEEPGLSRLTWFTGFVTTLFIPLLILLITHGVLRIPLVESQGHGDLSVLYLDYLVASDSDADAFAASGVMESLGRHADDAAVCRVRLSVRRRVLHGIFVPESVEVASYFSVADLPDWLFDLIIVTATILTVAGWSYLYLSAHGMSLRMPAWVDGLRIRLYLPFMNRLYADEIYALTGQTVMRLAHQLDKRERGWSR